MCMYWRSSSYLLRICPFCYKKEVPQQNKDILSFFPWDFHSHNSQAHYLVSCQVANDVVMWIRYLYQQNNNISNRKYSNFLTACKSMSLNLKPVIFILSITLYSMVFIYWMLLYGFFKIISILCSFI